MSKAFTKESDEQAVEPLPDAPWPLPAGARNYMTPSGARALRAQLAEVRAALEAPLSPARRRELERDQRMLERRFAEGEVVEPSAQPKDRVLFGARVTVRDEAEAERCYWIVGVDQADPPAGRLSWHSALARALLGARAGEQVTLRLPSGEREVEVLAVDYPDDP